MLVQPTMVSSAFLLISDDVLSVSSSLLFFVRILNPTYVYVYLFFIIPSHL